MRAAFSLLVATVFVSGPHFASPDALAAPAPLLGQIRHGADGSVPGAQEPPIFGSSVPCAVPLRWRVAEVDQGFELSEAEARRAVREAAALWEGAVERELFVHDPEGGFPVRFEYDDRQASLRLRQRILAELNEADRTLDVRRRDLTVWRRRLEAARGEHEERRDALRRSTQGHNVEVARWNDRGGAPESVRRELERRGAALEIERRSLERQAEELRGIQEWIRAEVDRLNRGIQELNRRGEALRTDFPVSVAESGRYAESVRLRNGEVVAVDRQIRVFRFADADELVLVLAHELGHALGLGHAGAAGAVMSEVSPGGSDSGVRPGLHRRDVEMLRARCPKL